MCWREVEMGDSITPCYIENIIQNTFGIVNVIFRYLQFEMIELMTAIQRSVAFWLYDALTSITLPFFMRAEPYVLAPSLCVLHDNTLTTASSAVVQKTWPFFSAL